MKIVCFADVHAHLFSDFAEPDAEFGNTRFRVICDVLKKIGQEAVEHEAKVILFAGDLFHRRVTVDTIVMNKVFDIVKEMASKIPVVMIPGNHDQRDNSPLPPHSLHVFRHVSGITLLDTFEPYDIEGIRIYPAPYSKDVNMVKEKIEEYAKDEFSGIKILLGHMGISGAVVGKTSYSMQDAFSLGDLFPDKFDFGVFGHYHRPQFLGDTKHYFYAGSPLQHSFHDEGEKRGYFLIDTETKTATKFHIKSPEFITVTNPEHVNENLEGNYVRFQIPSEKIEEVSEVIPDELKYRIEPVKEYKEEKRIDIDHSMSHAEIIKRYVQEFRPDDPETEKLMLEILQEVEL